jgi:hypothetical protein
MRSLSTGCPRKKSCFESTKGLFNGSQNFFIHANYELQIIDAVKPKENGIKKELMLVVLRLIKQLIC